MGFRSEGNNQGSTFYFELPLFPSNVIADSSLTLSRSEKPAVYEALEQYDVDGFANLPTTTIIPFTANFDRNIQNSQAVSRFTNVLGGISMMWILLANFSLFFNHSFIS